MYKVEIRSVIHSLTKGLTTHVARDAKLHVNPNASTAAWSIRDFFTGINPPTFYGFKVDEDPQVFIYEKFKVLHAMGVASQEKVELAAYKL